jgi:pyruvate dehydrogenase complex dehydrogenase (E1) component
MLKYILKMKDGSVGIMTLIEGTPEAAIAKMINKNDIVSFREVLEIPQDREFRNAWCDVTKEAKVDIDIKKAKDIKLKELREKRQPKLDELDKEMLKALENDDEVKKAEIKAAKQALRDITEPLKNLAVDGVNNNVLLQQIKDLGTFNG